MKSFNEIFETSIPHEIEPNKSLDEHIDDLLWMIKITNKSNESIAPLYSTLEQIEIMLFNLKYKLYPLSEFNNRIFSYFLTEVNYKAMVNYTTTKLENDYKGSTERYLIQAGEHLKACMVLRLLKSSEFIFKNAEKKPTINESKSQFFETIRDFQFKEPQALGVESRRRYHSGAFGSEYQDGYDLREIQSSIQDLYSSYKSMMRESNHSYEKDIFHFLLDYTLYLVQHNENNLIEKYLFYFIITSIQHNKKINNKANSGLNTLITYLDWPFEKYSFNAYNYIIKAIFPFLLKMNEQKDSPNTLKYISEEPIFKTYLKVETPAELKEPARNKLLKHLNVMETYYQNELCKLLLKLDQKKRYYDAKNFKYLLPLFGIVYLKEKVISDSELSYDVLVSEMKELFGNEIFDKQSFFRNEMEKVVKQFKNKKIEPLKNGPPDTLFSKRHPMQTIACAQEQSKILENRQKIKLP